MRIHRPWAEICARSSSAKQSFILRNLSMAAFTIIATRRSLTVSAGARRAHLSPPVPNRFGQDTDVHHSRSTITDMCVRFPAMNDRKTGNCSARGLTFAARSKPEVWRSTYAARRRRDQEP
jgi:hypothetical protein